MSRVLVMRSHAASTSGDGAWRKMEGLLPGQNLTSNCLVLVVRLILSSNGAGFWVSGVSRERGAFSHLESYLGRHSDSTAFLCRDVDSQAPESRSNAEYKIRPTAQNHLEPRSSL